MVNPSFKIGNCQVIPSEFSLQLEGEEKLSIQPKFIEVLCYLAKHYPRVIPRSELIDNIWGNESFVGDKSLTNAIWHLRRNLIDVNGDKEVIETIRKAGYRLLIEPQFEQSLTTEEQVNTSTNNTEETNNHLPSKTPWLKQPFLVIIVIIVIMLTLTVSYFYSEFHSKPPQVSQVTQHPGSELFPSASPDGRYIAYSQISTNQPNNIFYQDTWQPQLPAKQLTFDQALEGHSVWSNDGQYLYFSRKDKVNNTCYYIQLKVHSQQEKRLVNCPIKGGYYYLDISPDDKTLAVYGFKKGDQNTGIYLLDLTQVDKGFTRFSCNDCDYKDRDMAFSPDGKSIAISRRFNRFSENIYLVNLTNKSTQQLTYNEEDIVGLSWHPSGNKLVYATHRAGVRAGFVYDVTEKTSQPLNLPGFSYPSFAKKSEQLYYQQREENYFLASLQLNSGIAQSPFPVIQSTFNHAYPDYSATNKRIAYVSNESGYDELWSSNVDGSKRVKLTQLKKNIRFPKWSHDGQSIAFLAENSKGTGDSIYIFSLKKQKLSLLSSPFSKHNRPSWSWNDSEIISAIYSKEFTDIYSINIDDGKTKRLTFDGGRYGEMISATTLVYTKLKRGLWQKEVNTNTELLAQSNQTQSKLSKNIINGSQFTTLYAWTFGDQQVFFHQAFKDHHQIMAYNFKQQSVKPLVRLPLNGFSINDPLTYVADREQLIYTGVNFPQANIKMIANAPLLQ